MHVFRVLFAANLKRRLKDGFAVGYNLIFPLFMIWLLGLLCKGMYEKGTIGSYEYYAVVTIPYCILLSVVTAAYAGKDDAYANTADRILIAPVSNGAIVFSKIFAEVVVFSGCSFVVLLLSYFLWDVCSLLDMWKLFICYGFISFAAACVGTFIGLGMKDFMKIKNVLAVPVLVFAILGGSFYPFGTFHKLLSIVLDLSPVRWLNRAMFLMLYDHSDALLYIVEIVMAAVGTTFALLSIKCFKREEYGNGELPGYEK